VQLASLLKPNLAAQLHNLPPPRKAAALGWIQTIGDLLGHHSLESTCVYLRIETDMLRTVALAAPGGAAR